MIGSRFVNIQIIFVLHVADLAGKRSKNIVQTLEQISLKSNYDAVIVGGGSAGVAAAIASAREGLETLLLVRGSELGGNLSQDLVHSISGLYLISNDVVPHPANGGLALEFTERLLKTESAMGPVRMNRVDVLLQEPQLFSIQCTRLCGKEKNLTVVFNSTLRSVLSNETVIESIEIDTHPEPIRAAVFVDASSDAKLSFLAGADYEEADPAELQRAAYIFSIGNVNLDDVDDNSRFILSQKIVAGIRDGSLDPQLAVAVMRPTGLAEQVRWTIDLESEGDHYSPLNPECLTRLQILGCQLAAQLEAYLRASVEGFEKCRITASPGQTSARESRRVSGRYCLTEKDILDGVEFEDAVCRSAWPIELRETVRGQKSHASKKSKPCDIPLRALISKDFDNLLMAGRCISATHRAQGALRVIGTCLAVGQAAGLAAATIKRSPTGKISPGEERAAAAPIREKIFCDINR